MIRVFGSQTCSKCESICKSLKAIGMNFEFVDAFAEENQDFCDQHDVEALPHVQIFENDRMLWEKNKSVTILDILAALRQIQTSNQKS